MAKVTLKDVAAAAGVGAVERALRPVFWVGHELSNATRGYLKEDLMTIVLDQAPEVQARRAIDLTFKRLGLIDPEPVRFLTVTAESL